MLSGTFDCRALELAPFTGASVFASFFLAFFFFFLLFLFFAKTFLTSYREVASSSAFLDIKKNHSCDECTDEYVDVSSMMDGFL